MRRLRAALLAVPFLLAGCTGADPAGADADPSDGESSEGGEAGEAPAGWVYQLTDYADGGLAELAAAEGDAAVVDLARDGGEDYFTAEEIAGLRESGKAVYAYFTVGSIETYRPEYAAVAATDMVLNRWGDWPDEYFVAYWDQRWWDLAVRPRLDRALAAGFDGVYLDVPNAYEEIDLELVPGEDRDSLARKMVDLIAAVDDYAAAERPGFQVLPQNAPELREFPGYMESIDGIGVEDLFFLDSDEPCEAEWCGENLDHVRAIAASGKLVLAVDYATEPANVAEACARYAEEGFTGYVTTVELDAISAPCGHD
ncbi:endo alpha-1,4 polygalactosaminidase [Glycomyces arizonensis]|uniref:endo alpha-1,4 polygalactosaminidase n=1 Tax=Glycomyces arizonensis TaxID=256035 RepID=UPI0003F98B02|nr:endo alpha-1,4 polygalactosaminidase [Glycomyces arizonensis]